MNTTNIKFRTKLDNDIRNVTTFTELRNIVMHYGWETVMDEMNSVDIDIKFYRKMFNFISKKNMAIMIDDCKSFSDIKILIHLYGRGAVLETLVYLERDNKYKCFLRQM